MNRCPAHDQTPPLPPVRPFRHDAPMGICKNCTVTIGTERDRRAHHCPCCGDRLTGGCLGTRRGAARCPNCGLVDTGSREFLPEPDPLTDLLTGVLDPPAAYAAAEAVRARFGPLVAHHTAWTWQEPGIHHGHLTVHGDEIRLRVRTDSGAIEAAAPCPNEGCRGCRWARVDDPQALLALHQRGAPPNAPCDRQNKH
ncbi:hypothetical protein [Streptomyces cavernicola]|uniref:Uncharacterized protein n=1 Tax=Streptomyces cavernicola TaxID=3043613 RepID=A0ABT6SJF9_9ACTN|nr:hypothetical protein [Streptomyces sp. B-S-A6]MDI3408327.1 hypothetical protein [Streptomyces sp. B-S-A6]